MNLVSSVLLIDKPTGVTSFSSLSPIKREIDKKVGHAGTLDKFAHGLMIVLTGRMTKLNSIFSSLDKTYEATFEFGKMTDTLDPEGEVIQTGPIPTLEEITQAVKEHFDGPILQVPPKYSAIHLNGKRAYELVREGKEVPLIAREVTLYSVDITSYTPPFVTLTIHCSKGTYIRSLARDIAAACNTVAYVTKLERTSIGPYSIQESVSAHDKEALYESLKRSEELLLLHPLVGTIIIDDKAVIPLSHGNLPKNEYIIDSKIQKKTAYAIVYSKDNVMLAVVALDDNKQISSSVAILN
jgi:tRNA pseudouridine55 synthase